MNYKLLSDLLVVAEQFENKADRHIFSSDIQGLKQWWLGETMPQTNESVTLDYEGKNNGRSLDSVINTLFVHLNRYAKTYARAAIQGSPFSTPDEFIYLITLTAFGPMSKSALIRRNIHEKPIGIQIINRLIRNGWVVQVHAEGDKRAKIVSLTMSGGEILNAYMGKIRIASGIVTGNLNDDEKTTLIRLLMKLDIFHQEIFKADLALTSILETASAIKDKQQEL